MGTLLLRLAAPLQSWGIDSKFEARRTEREPSKSGVIGLLAAALGVSRDDEATLARLSSMRFGIRVEQEGELLRDYHTARNEKTTYVTHRYYLSDAVFLAALESEDEELLSELENALHHPVFPLFLGRRSCPPMLPISLGVRKTGLLQTLNSEPWRASERYMHKAENPSLRILLEASDPLSSAKSVKDLPVSFSPFCRRYTYRAMSDEEFIEPPSIGDTEHDAMQELR